MGHQEAGLAGSLSKQLDQFTIRSEEQLRYFVKSSRHVESGKFGGGSQFGGQILRPGGEQPGHAASGKLMKIGLPGGRQGDAQIVRQQSAQDSNVARARDVNDIRVEIAQETQKPGIVPQEQKIELVVAIEREFDPAAAELNSGDRSFCYHFVPRARVNQEKCESAFFCKCGKLPAGVRDAVDFTVRTRK
jgi:hypothetical protein